MSISRRLLHKIPLFRYKGASSATARSPIEGSRPAPQPVVQWRHLPDERMPMATLSDTVQTAFDRAAAQRTLVLPTIPEELHALEADELLSGPDTSLEAIDARDLDLTGEAFCELEAAGARFASCHLADCDFTGALFTDTAFEDCDFANTSFDNVGFTRCTFKNCKLTGASFTEANLEQVSFTDCTLAYSAQNRCRWWGVEAMRCDFSGADMAEMELHYVLLDDDRFVGTSFFRTALLGLDFTTCQLEGVSLSDTMAEIYGTKMNVYQAAALARRLGVIVSE
ncbi:pentapeptide repeat-containing protein [Adlercreutzia muris]|nr:pentapeptide repeat-containing protein [Adlercreutzia muris]